MNTVVETLKASMSLVALVAVVWLVGAIPVWWLWLATDVDPLVWFLGWSLAIAVIAAGWAEASHKADR